MDATEVNLPAGFAAGGQWCRTAWLHPLTGYDEEFLLCEGKLLSVAARVTHLLTRCLRRLGPLEPVDMAIVRRLTVGDREALLLQLRRLALGDRMACLLACPNCEKKMELDMQISELLLAPYAHANPTYETEILCQGHGYRVLFRLPTGEDQEAVAALATGSVESASEALLRRCIAKVTSGDGQPTDEIPSAVLNELPQKMAELDPQAEVLLKLGCPECHAQFVVPFDSADYICREMSASEREFYREIHTLSFHYHWDEDAILSMNLRKRRIYLDLLTDELSGGSHS
jgi:hypothetical protein